jgi:hypothetical protein
MKQRAVIGKNVRLGLFLFLAIMPTSSLAFSVGRGFVQSNTIGYESSSLRMSSETQNDNDKIGKLDALENQQSVDPFRKIRLFFSKESELKRKRPPLKAEDINLLYYDVFLIINLSMSIGFWVIHRMDFAYLPLAFNEGCLLSLAWILSGLYNGAFLYSAVDGHYGSSDERGGPKAAAMLGFHTFLGTVNIRLLFALASAVVEHRPVGISPGEEIMPLEIGLGLILMAVWRAAHSSNVPRF